MLKLVRSIVSRLVCRFRSRAAVELENLALRHQLHVLRRQRPGRLRLFTFDRLIILTHDRRKIIRTDVTEHPTATWLSRQVTEAFPVGHRSALSAARSRRVVWLGVSEPGRSDGHYGSHHGATLTLAERICRARDRLDTSRVFRSHRDLQRTPSSPRLVLVCRLLPTHPHASFARQGLPRLPPDSASQRRKSRRDTKSRWLASSLRTSGRLICPGFLLTNLCAAARTRSFEDPCVGGLFDLDQSSAADGSDRSPSHFERTNSIAIVAAAQIPVQMEFLVATINARVLAPT